MNLRELLKTKPCSCGADYEKGGIRIEYHPEKQPQRPAFVVCCECGKTGPEVTGHLNREDAWEAAKEAWDRA